MKRMWWLLVSNSLHFIGLFCYVKLSDEDYFIGFFWNTGHFRWTRQIDKESRLIGFQVTDVRWRKRRADNNAIKMFEIFLIF